MCGVTKACPDGARILHQTVRRVVVLLHAALQMAGLAAVQPASGLASDDVDPDAHAKKKSQGKRPLASRIVWLPE